MVHIYVGGLSSELKVYIPITHQTEQLTTSLYTLQNAWDIACGWMLRLVAQSCPTLCNVMDRSPPGSSVHGILQARILQWVALSSSEVSSWPVSLASREFTSIYITHVFKYIMYCVGFTFFFYKSHIWFISRNWLPRFGLWKGGYCHIQKSVTQTWKFGGSWCFSPETEFPFFCWEISVLI